jgi:hypothetical protein
MREINKKARITHTFSKGHAKGLPNPRLSLPNSKGNNSAEKCTEE